MSDAQLAGPTQDEPAQTDAGKRPSRKRLIIQAVIGVAVMVGIFVVLLPDMGNYEQAFFSLGNIPIWAVFGLAVACILNIALYPLTVLVSVPGLKYWPGFMERQVGFLISCAIPGGGVFAVGAQYRILSYYNVTAARAAAAVTADAVWVYLLTLAMPSIAIGWLVIEGRNSTGYATLAIIGALVVIVSIVLIYLVLRNEDSAQKVGRFAQRLVDPVMKRFKKEPPDLEVALLAFRNNAHDLVSKRWKAITLTNAIAQLTPFLILTIALAGLGAYPGTLTLGEVFAAYSIALLLVSIPITPGGLGTVDFALIALLKSFGCEGDIAVAADVLWRLVWFLPQILAGIGSMFAFFLVQRRSARLQE